MTTPLAANAPLSLQGEWRFALERYDNAVAERWWERTLPDSIHLPGTLPAQGIGHEVTVGTKWTGTIFDPSYYTAPEYEEYRRPGNIKLPFWLQPDRTYAGAAWYQRDFEIPVSWQARRVVLLLERPHWETRVWIDSLEIGSNNSLSTPHEYDLGTGVAPGKHRLTIRVDNRLIVDVGVNSHSVTDHTQGNWNGIIGRIELSATSPVWIDDAQVYPNVAARSAVVKVRIGNATGKTGRGTLSVGAKSVAVCWDEQGGTAEADVPLGDGAKLWDEFSPHLHELTITLCASRSDTPVDSRSVRFGLREISTHGTQFVINGRKLFFRGALECCIFPLTGHPPTDVDSWKRICGIARAHGMNHLRFHSWCPPEAAFLAGDEVGMYYQIECGSWSHHGATVGDGKPVDPWIHAEADRILKAYGNHPCFVLLSYGNEPDGVNHKSYLGQWVNQCRARDARRLYTGGSGWPEIPENQFHVTHPPRIHQWGDGLKSRLNALAPATNADYRDYIQARGVPVISHEIGQWCAYPDSGAIPKYTGHLKPKNLEIFRDTLRRHHLGDQGHEFLLASGKLQTLCYKEEIESALRTPGMGGFQLLGLHDFPGQGTAPVGVLDSFWQSKGYVTDGEYSRFCNSTVLLARMEKRVFMTGETFCAEIEVAHFGPLPLENAATYWRLVADDGRPVASGKLPTRTIPVDNGVKIGSLAIDLGDVPAPHRYKLVVGIEGTPFENDWDVWVYPQRLDTPAFPGITMVEDVSAGALGALAAGGRVLLLIPPDRVNGDDHGRVELGFSSIFWNTACTRGQPPHTLGILCDPRHPALAEFPTESHSNWQWWYLVSRAGAMILDGLPPSLQPVVQVIDDWFTNRKLGLVFEGKVGAGRLLVCSIDLKGGGGQNPVASQMLHSLLRYMSGDKFQPATEIAPEQLRGLLAARREQPQKGDAK